MHGLNLAAKKKNRERRVGYAYASTKSTKSLIILKDSLIIEERKLKMTFLKKQKVWGHGSFTISLELEFDLPHKLHYLFHATSIDRLEIYFQL